MTVANHDTRNQYTAVGGQTVFTYNFEITDGANLLVYQRAGSAEPDDAADLLTYNVDYTVTGVGAENGGTIVLTSGATLNDIVTIDSGIPAERDTSFTPNGIIKAEDLNIEFDNLVLILQRILTTQDELTPKYPSSAYVQAFDLVLPVLSADETWVMNSAGNQIVAASFPSNGAASKIDTYVTIADETADEPNSFPLANIGSGIMINNVGGAAILVREMMGTANQLGITNGTGLVGNPTYYIVNNPIIPGTAGMGIPIGTTAQRVVPVSNIGLRYNTDLAQLEFYAGGVWNQLEDSGDLAALIAQLASNAAGDGASMIGLEDQGTVSGKTVQDLAELSFVTVNNDTAVALNSQQLSALALLLTGGTMAGNINMNNNSITNLAAPVAGGDAVNKTYADLMLPLAGGVMSGNINLNNAVRVTNALDPIANQDYATKFYVDQNSLNGTSVYAATTANLNVTQAGAGAGATLTDASGTFAPLTLDAVAVPLNSNVLIKDLAAPQNEGIYKLTTNGDGISIPYVLTRSVGYDTATEINNTGLIVIQNGATLAGQTWYNTTNIVTVDTTAFSFSQFGAAFLSNVLATGKIFRGNGSNLAVATTASFADTYGASELLYSNGANNVTGLATGNSMVLVTSAGGVPSWSTSLPAGLTIPGYALSGANSDITSLTGLTGTLQAPTGIKSSAGVDLMAFTYTASAVNYLTFANNTTGTYPIIGATGSDGTVALNLHSKGNIFQFSPNNATGDAHLKLFLANGTDFVGLKAPSATGTSPTFVLPSAVGAKNAVMTSDTSGNLSLVDSGAKVLCNKLGNGTTVNYGLNVSSTTHAATGTHVISFTTSFADANYITNANSLIAATLQFCIVQSQATGSVSINTYNTAGTLTDPTQLLVSCFGAQ